MATRPRDSVTTPDAVLRFREQFPIFETKVHLANNSKGALGQAAIAAHAEYLATWRELGAPWDVWVGKHEQLRASFAAMIGAQQNEVAICSSVSTALAAVASSFDWRKRNGIVFDDFSFPSVTYLWHAQTMRGAQVARVHPSELGEIAPSDFEPLVDSKTQAVSIAHVCYKNGHRHDLPRIAEIAHDAGALFIVDDYQSSGSRALDVRAAGIDILVTGTVKFLLGSAGVALMYVRKELLDQLHPTITGWFGQRDPEDFQVERHQEAADATRFQSGTPAIPSVYDSLAGVELIRSIGLDTIGRWIDGLTAYAMERLREADFVPATPHDPGKRGPQVAVRSNDVERAVEELANRNIVATHRDGNVRAAFHYYNTFDDVDAFVTALEQISHLMVRP